MRNAVAGVLVMTALWGCKQETPKPVGSEPGFEGCEQACGTKQDFKEADVVSQPGARPGDLARCPVSDAVFEVKADSAHQVVDGKTIYTCCPSCAEHFANNPARFMERL